MFWNLLCKVIKKKVFDLLTYRFSTLFLVVLLTIFLTTLFHFGEVVITWSEEKYNCALNVFRDNIKECSYQQRLCSKLPIDVVYTWVNGSDPFLIEKLVKLKQMNFPSSDKILDECLARDNCFPSNGLIMESDFKNDLQTNDIFKDSFSAVSYSTNFKVNSKNLTCIIFKTRSHLEKFIDYKNQNSSMQDKYVESLYFTIDLSISNIHNNKKIFIFPEEYTKSIETKIHQSLNKSDILDIVSDSDNKLVIVFTKNEVKLPKSLSTLFIKSVSLQTAAFIWRDNMRSLRSETSDSRFRDNDELKYSLRSLFKFAPWVRKVFIVTNDQIPSWLNVHHPRVVLVSHADIFANHSHLPTFSSPAIESNLVNIAALSERFIYMNDDFFLAMPVWPDDFESEEGLFRVYLTYPVPSCREGCPNSWLADGYCDKACNNSECDFDGGDCNNVTLDNDPKNTVPTWVAEYMKAKALYCHEGCSDNWLADGYCDEACNLLSCGFDAGDCGVDDFDKVQGVSLKLGTTFYNCTGHKSLYFDYQEIQPGSLEIENGSFSEADIVRRFAIAKKFTRVVLVLRENFTSSLLNCTLQFQNVVNSFNFVIALDTTFIKPLVPLKVPSKPAVEAQSEKFPFANYSNLSPRLLDVAKQNLSIDLSNKTLPKGLMDRYERLAHKHRRGHLTRRGFEAAQYRLVEGFLQRRRQDHSQQAVQFFMDSLKDSPFPTILKLQQPNKTLNGGREVFSNIPARKNFEVGDKNNESNSSIVRRVKSSSYDTQTNSSMRKLHMVINDNDHRWSPSKQTEYERDVSKFMRSYAILPWERRKKLQSKSASRFDYFVGSVRGRRLLDAFSDSIRHVNRLYNRVYGSQNRKVPGHAAYYFKKSILKELLSKFRQEFDQTSSNKLRSETDMQLPFAYYYFLMSEQRQVSVEEIFKNFDADASGVWSDKDLRVLATRLYKEPLSPEDLRSMEAELMECKGDSVDDAALQREHYSNEQLPQVTLELVKRCERFRQKLTSAFGNRSRYEHTVVDKADSVMTFLMLGDDAFTVAGQLDGVRRKPTKFVCLNDDVQDDEAGGQIQALVRDFYQSFYPLPSPFELPDHQTLPFDTIEGYRTYLRHQHHLRLLGAVGLALLVSTLVFCFVARRRICRLLRLNCARKHKRHDIHSF